MSKYREHREKLQKMWNEGTHGIVFYAFSDEQLKEGMKKIGAKKTKELYGTGSGGFYKKSDAPKIRQLMFDLSKAEYDYIKNGTVEDMKDMFLTVMADHEYSITGDLEDTFYELDLDPDKVVGDPKLLEGLRLALEEYGEKPRKWMEVLL